MATDRYPVPGRFASLRHARYRHRCIATLFANVGHWSQLSAVAWYVVESVGRLDLGGFVQSAAMAPVLLFTMAAGMLVDRYDGDVIQRWAQSGAMICACALAWAAWTEAHPYWLLGALFMHGVGLAVRAPAWQASLPALVGHADLPGAILLNASAFNLARIAGAALGGLLLPAFGLVAVCVLNALLAAGLLLVLLAHRGSPARGHVSRNGAAMQTLAHPFARRVAWRSLALGVPASAILALLPAHVSGSLAGDAAAYGQALAWFGAGAVVAGLCATGAHGRRGVERELATRALVLAAAMAALACCHAIASAAVCLLVAGGAWTTLFARINTALQLGVPDAMRGTALALYITCMFGGMTFGSAAWSLLADSRGTAFTLGVAALALACCVFLGVRWPLPSGPRPSSH